MTNTRLVPLLGVVAAAVFMTACGGSAVPSEVAASGVAVTIDPSNATIGAEGSLPLTAAVTGSAVTTVVWTVTEAGGGTVNASGLYAAPGTEGTFHVVATSTADRLVSATATVTVVAVIPPPPPPATKPVVRVGGHIPAISGWTPAVYANVLKQGRKWCAQGTLNTLAANQVDVNGNPTTDARSLYVEGSNAGPNAVVAGTYKLAFNGQATISVGDIGSVQNQVYNAATNTTTADVIVPSSGSNYWVDLSNAWRKADHTADATGNARGFTNARLMAPSHAWPGDYWRKEVVSMNNVFSVIRFSAALGPSGGGCNNASGVMDSCDTTWSTRSRPGFYGYAEKGMPWEDTVIFANLTGVDIWVNIPIGADNDYITKVYQLLKYGSDGNLPYTVQTHDPATWTPAATWYPGLLPGRKVYMEFTNELFTYYGYGDSRATADINAGDPHHLAWDGKTSNPGDRWGGWNAVRLSLLARQVWGDAAMQDTIRIVYANQGDWGAWGRHQSAMDYITAVWGPGSTYNTIDGFTNPKQPVSYYLHNISGSFYLHAPMNNGVPTATSVGSVGTLGVRTDGSGFLGQLKEQLSCSGAGLSYESSSYERQQDGENMAARYGIKFTSYETGIEIFNAGSVGAAWSDPGMKTIYYNLLAHSRTLPHADVMVQSGTVRGIYPTNELSRSYAASDGFPWPLSGTAAPSPSWQAVIDFAAGR
jgi:hypothetical protein